MASIIRRTYTVKLPNGRKVVKRCEHFTIQYRDDAGKIRRVKGYRDKGATKQLAAKLESALARGEQGLVDPYKVARARPLSEHVTEYVADLRAAGRDRKYIDNMQRRLTILADGCGWRTLPEVEANSFMRWRDAESKLAPRWKGREQKADRVSAATLNQYLDTARAFLNWCVASKRCPLNPLADVNKVTGEKKRKRRALSDEEVTRLMTAAPEERRIVYRLGIGAGLRRAELEDLEWGDVRLNAIRPYIELRAEATKARRGDRLPLAQSLADDLRKLKPDDAGEGDMVFRRVPSLVLWKNDLRAAGIPYADAQGRVVDFHAGTRKTLCTRLHRGGVPLATAMRLMRHTDAKLTMVDYTDDAQLGIDVPMLAEILPAAPTPAAATQTATG